MLTEVKNKGGLSKTALQMIAIIAMVIDHFAFSFISNMSLLYYIMRFIGKLTIVIICYFVAEGYFKTSNLKKYITRMGIFAIISQVPFYLFARHCNVTTNIKGLIFDMFAIRNVIFTLFVGLCLLAIIKAEYKVWLKIVAVAAALYLTRQSDWGHCSLLWIVGFGLIRDKKSKQMLWAALVIILGILMEAPPIILGAIAAGGITYKMLELFTMFGSFLAIPLLWSYNGKRGANLKWGFYVFYPLHLVIIVLLMIF